MVNSTLCVLVNEEEPYSMLQFNDEEGFPTFLRGFMNPNRGFSENYRCYPIAMMQHGNDRDNVNYGGKSKRNSNNTNVYY